MSTAIDNVMYIFVFRFETHLVDPFNKNHMIDAEMGFTEQSIAKQWVLPQKNCVGERQHREPLTNVLQDTSLKIRLSLLHTTLKDGYVKWMERHKVYRSCFNTEYVYILYLVTLDVCTFWTILFIIGFDWIHLKNQTAMWGNSCCIFIMVQLLNHFVFK